MEKRKTIKGEINFKGKGLDKGEICEIILKPNEKKGIFFLVEGKFYPLKELEPSYSKRGTCLIFEKNSVLYVEHLMSAIYGTGIDDVIIEIKGDEIPFFDGSAKIFIEKILEKGLEEKEEELEFYKVKKAFSKSFNGSRISILPGEDFEISYKFTREPYLKYRYDFIFSKESYVKEIAPSKTFITYEEAKALKEKGFFEGGDENLAIIFKDNDIINKSILTFEDEPARHKILDVIGDISLLGKRFKGKFLFEGTGHRDHIEFLPFLEAFSGYGREIDSEEIRKILPHDYPFLLVDKVLSLEEDRIVGIKNVSYNEEFFKGHFPERKIMPGVLIVEAIVQTGGILVFERFKEEHSLKNKIPVFTGIENVKFKKAVYPSDTLYMVVELLRFKGKVCKLRGFALKEEGIVCEGTFTAIISDV
ncbi:MAG: 3-hydroxyacyl-ACP dehydratase FabZ [candidate division WOR-3 bacterium]